MYLRPQQSFVGPPKVSVHTALAFTPPELLHRAELRVMEPPSTPFALQTSFPSVIFSYCTKTDGGRGEQRMWQIANFLKKHGIASFNGKQVEVGRFRKALELVDDERARSFPVVTMQHVIKSQVPVTLRMRMTLMRPAHFGADDALQNKCVAND